MTVHRIPDTDLLRIRDAQSLIAKRYRDHEMVVAWSAADDQIHLLCLCGWDDALGVQPDPFDIERRANGHIIDEAIR